jgi:hypothetical protein
MNLCQPRQLLAAAVFAIGSLLHLSAATDALPSGFKPITFDMEAPFVPVNLTPGSKSTVSGFIPAGWDENSGWVTPDGGGANVEVSHSQAEEGGRFLRMHVRRVTSRSSTLLYNPVPLAPSVYYKVSLKHRSQTSASFRLGLRGGGDRYRTIYWSQAVNAAPEWGTFTTLVPPNDDPNATLVLSVDSPGMVDLDDLTLTPVAKAKIEAAGPKLTGNLLPSSVFPQGVPKPWVTGNFAFGPEDYRSDSANPGPSGFPALQLVTLNASLETLFTGQPGSPHTFSVFLKADQPGTAVNLLLGPQNAMSSTPPFGRTVTVGPKWERYTVTATLPFGTEPVYVVKVVPPRDRTVWVDAAQVEVGDQAGEPRRTGTLELQTFPVRNYGLSFLGEPLEVDVLAIGAVPSGAKITGTLIPLSGGARSLPALELKPLKGSAVSQKITFFIPPGDEPALGYYRVEIQAVDAAGKPLSAKREIPLARVRPPRVPDAYAPDSPFGIHIGNSIWEVQPESLTRFARDIGFKWARTSAMRWDRLERPDGTFDFSESDKEIQNLEAYKVSVLATLGKTPKWYSVEPADVVTGRGHNAAPRPEHLDKWEDYARRLGERYKGRVTAWETWNEPDLPSFLFTKVEDPATPADPNRRSTLFPRDTKRFRLVGATVEEFAAIHRAAYRGLKTADPANRVSWNLAGVLKGVGHVGEAGEDWKEAVARAIGDNADFFTYHFYNSDAFGTPDDAISRMAAASRERGAASGRPVPVWNSEGGRGVDSEINALAFTPPVRLDRGNRWAERLVRYYVSTLASGTEKFFLFNLHLGTTSTTTYSSLNHDGSVSPLMPAFSNLAWHIEGQNFVRTVTVAPALHLHAFQARTGPGSTLVVLANGLDRVVIPEPIPGVTARDLYGNDLSYPLKLGDGVVFLSAATDAETLIKKIPAKP